MHLFLTSQPWLGSSCPLPPVTQCPSAWKHTPWLSSDQSSRAVHLRLWGNDTSGHWKFELSGVFFSQAESTNVIYSETWCIIETENSVGIWRKVNFIHKGARRGGGDPRLGKWATEAAKCGGGQPWNQPDPIDSVYLAQLQVKANWKSGGDLEGAVIQGGRGGGE